MATTAHNAIRTMDPRKIMFNEKNPRSNLGDISHLVASIKSRVARGLPPLIQDITIRPFESSYKVVAGSKRLAASLESDVDEIGVRIEIMTDEDAHEVATMENIIRHQMSTYDEIMAIAKMEMNGIERAEIASRFGRPVRWVGTRIRLAGAGDVILDLIKRDKLPIGHAEELVRIETSDERDRLASCCATWPLSQLTSTIDGQMRDISRAPWIGPHVDGLAGCANCLSRSDHQCDIFGDCSGPARCLDLSCWDRKLTQFVNAKKDELRKAGHMPAQSWSSVWTFRDCKGSTLDPQNKEEAATIAEMEAAGIKPRFMVLDDGEVLLRYDADDVPEKTVLTPSGDEADEEDNDDDLPEAMVALSEDDLADDEEQDDDAPERPKTAWQLRAERLAELKEALADDDKRSIDSLKLLEYLAEVYRSNCSTPELEKLKEHDRADSVIGADTNCIKRAILADIVSHYFACDDLGDCVESVEEWDEFKRVFWIGEPEVG